MKISCPDTHGNTVEFDESAFIDRESIYGVVIRDNKILMVQDAVSGTWEFPGGGVETEEEPMAGMKREFLEETGLEIGKRADLITSFIEYYKDVHSERPWKSHRSFYRVEITGGTLMPEGNGDDTVKAAFLPLDNVLLYPLREPVRTVIMVVRKG